MHQTAYAALRPLVTPTLAPSGDTMRILDELTVVSPRGLIALKSFRASGQDRGDIDYLRSIADEDAD